ncbi:hypothetical protein BDN71DRAFT_1427227 [Pleurotus eryngii]|uniref:Uncharacterized protein n=1 Tax=Pleurotus eryngii TaxID=5323 RepID=A0A9P6A6A9_PLEER|nr:hypothetical protein BDN71DRAFT_1427227 [Pleurotus eryngii]
MSMMYDRGTGRVFYVRHDVLVRWGRRLAWRGLAKTQDISVLFRRFVRWISRGSHAREGADDRPIENKRSCIPRAKGATIIDGSERDGFLNPKAQTSVGWFRIMQIRGSVGVDETEPEVQHLPMQNTYHAKARFQSGHRSHAGGGKKFPT